MDANKIIDELGGTCAVASICEVTTGAVSQWRLTGIPKPRLMYLRLLRPEVFERIEHDSGKAEETAERAA